MNTARASRIGEKRIQLLQPTGSLDAVVAVVGEYPEATQRGEHFDQFVAHLRAEPDAGPCQLYADRYQFPIEEPSDEAKEIIDLAESEHQWRTGMADCTWRCCHSPLPSLFPSQNWTLEKGNSSFDMRKAEFGRRSVQEEVPLAPDEYPRPGYEATLECLKVMVRGAVSLGLRGIRIVLSATNPTTLPPSRFSDEHVTEQQALIDSCTQVCHEISGDDGLVFTELHGVDSVRRFVGPASAGQQCRIHDHTLPMWY